MNGNISQLSLEFFADDGRFANSRQPAVIYGQALPAEDVSAEALEGLFDAIRGRCGGPFFLLHTYS